jgi:excisionase family DNA binding protein
MKRQHKLNINDDRYKSIEYNLYAMKSIFNIDELCEYIGLSKSHIYKLTCHKKIPFYKKSKHLYFDRVQIENWIKSSR